jgi:hypothetical protein
MDNYINNIKLEELKQHFDGGVIRELRNRVDDLVHEMHYEMPCGNLDIRNVLYTLDIVKAIADAAEEIN